MYMSPKLPTSPSSVMLSLTPFLVVAAVSVSKPTVFWVAALLGLGLEVLFFIHASHGGYFRIVEDLANNLIISNLL